MQEEESLKERMKTKQKQFLGWCRKVTKKQKEELEALCQEESGMGVVEIILIIVVLIGLVVIFKEQITKIVKSIMKAVSKDAKSVYQ